MADLDEGAVEAARVAWLEHMSDYTGLDKAIIAALIAYEAARPVSAGEAEASPAPAAMPSEEEIARIICRRVHEALYPNAGDWRPGELEQKVSIYWPHYANEARAVLALFAPIPAEKERDRFIDMMTGPDPAKVWKAQAHKMADLADAAEARALAAESALAAAREEGAREATERLEGVLARYIDMVGYNEGTDFIDSPGLNGPDEATLYRCSGRDERGEFTDASRANAAAIRAKE